MKKFILFIAVLTASIGSVYAEEWPISSPDDGTQNTSTVFPFNTATVSNSVALFFPIDRFKGIVKTHDYTVHSIHGIRLYADNITELNELINSITVDFSYATDKENTTPTQSITPNGTASIGNGYLEIQFGDIDFSSIMYDNNDVRTDGYIKLDISLQLTNATTSPVNWEIYEKDETTRIPKTTLLCVRKFANFTKNSNTYNVYSEKSDNITAYAELTEFSLPTTSSSFYVTRSTQSTMSNSANLFLEYYSVFEIPDQIAGFDFGKSKVYDVTVKKVSGAPFSSISANNNMAICFPNTIIEFANSDNSKGVFNLSGYGKNVTDVAFIIQPYTGDDNQPHLPALTGSSTANAFSKNGSGKEVANLYLKQGSQFDFATDNKWNAALQNIQKNGYVSYFYNIQFADAYNHSEINDEMVTSPETNGKYIYISSLPFGSNPLTIKLTGQQQGSKDGTYHRFNRIKATVNGYEPITASDENPDEITYPLNNDKTSFVVKAYYTAELLYKQGNPYYKFGDMDYWKFLTLFPDCQALTFKLYENNDGTYDNEKVPYWYYVSNGTHTSVTTTAPIHVEKEITSDHYRYFCLPFDCKTSDIDVRLIDSDGNISNARLPRYTSNFSDETYSDSYVINEYKGQSNGFGGDAVYAQPDSTDGSCTLGANKPYAFALVMADETRESKAIITFKSRPDNEEQTYTFNSWDATVDIPVEDEPREAPNGRNSGWNMIGNPYFHYLYANQFVATGNGTENEIKYITLINDDNEESVTHYWVKEQGNYGKYIPSDVTNEQLPGNCYIKPFQAFFVQVAQKGSISVDNTELRSPYNPYSDNTINIKQQLPAAQPDIQEHLSIKVMGQDSLSDRTTIINDENRDEHFQLMDDLAKMMNPWIQVYTWYDSVPCAFKELPLRADSSMAIPLGVKAIAAGNYTFSLDTATTLFYGAVMLHDKQANQYYPLNEEGVQISLNEGEENNRFEIVVIPSEIPADVENVETSETLDAYVHDGRLFVENIADGSTLSIYDISGRLLYNAPASGDFNYQFNTHGVYMVVLRGNTTGSIKVVY